VAECGGLLDSPALLALANFQVFSGLYVALSGPKSVSFAR